MNYPDSVQFLYALGNEIQTAKLGLERITAVLQQLGALHESLRFVHVAGTNGKGSTCAMLGDLNLAEPGALIGFAGPRVIEQTIRQKLPEGFQRSEFLLKHGMLDAVVPRLELKQYVATALRSLMD